MIEYRIKYETGFEWNPNWTQIGTLTVDQAIRDIQDRLEFRIQGRIFSMLSDEFIDFYNKERFWEKLQK